MNNFINDIDMLKSEHSLIKTYFNEMLQQAFFIRYLYYFSQGMGVGLQGASCTFPDSNDPEAHFEGVRFMDNLNDESPYNGDDNNFLYVDNETFYYYLSLACNIYLKSHIQSQTEISNILQMVKNNLYINSQ